MKIGDSNIELKWLGHAGFKIKNITTGRVYYIDPYLISNDCSDDKADVILLTHSHYDHCSIEDLKKIVKQGTYILSTPDSQSKLVRFDNAIVKLMEPNQELVLGNLKIFTLPSYNIDKSFHPKDEHWVGYIIKIGKICIYHAGDCDNIPELQKLTGHRNQCDEFIALLPVGGRFTMDFEEASDAASVIKPDLAIPMHYGSIVGSFEDAQEFVRLCDEKGIKAQILEKG
jgi:L-ascorbate metabolism protein UlaG (beta-lactamase superfamily)